ncbi:MAG: aminoacyl-histidine dipeptidase [Sphaerochaetaceae bacterium]|jgi:dipeptidase D
MSSSLDAIKGLRPANLWTYFYQLSQIPRESGNEAGVRHWLVAFAQEHGLRHAVDSVGNVIIYKEASKGYEAVPPVALQGHMDMVCVKTQESTHDFLKDPIELVRDGDFIRAKDTSLGGDNGIAVAMILDIFTDPSVKHGPLEAIFTVSEETGLTGAFGLDESLISSRRMLNLDSEEEGIIYIGCAGGIEVDATLKATLVQAPSRWESWSLRVDGLLGGHSGAEIHKQRANAIKLAARTLHVIQQDSPIMLASLQGGTKRNVIPSLCDAVFFAPKEAHADIEAHVASLQKAFAKEYGVSDPHASVTVSCQGTAKGLAMEVERTERFVDSLYIAPHGVDAMSMTIPGIVETSSNLAIVTLEDGAYHVVSSHRSSVMSARDDVAARMGVALATSGANLRFSGAYPSWTPDPSSKMASFCAKAYERIEGKKPVVTAIHAGLECGIINSKIPGMDSVSLGPDLFGVHSVNERLSIPSTERTSSLVKQLLAIIR